MESDEHRLLFILIKALSVIGHNSEYWIVFILLLNICI